MIRQFFALSLGFGGVILATQIAHAALQCDTRANVLAFLDERYGETRRAMGLTGARAGDPAGAAAVMEVFASEATGTWSILLTLPDGRTCLVASGDGFETVTGRTPARGENI